MKAKQVRIQLGVTQGIKLGVRKFSLRDPYYIVLTISWPAFFAAAVSFYLAVNLCFALAYSAVPGSVNNARPGVFHDVFFFSIETLATVGYGVMSPANVYGHIVASCEIIFGMMSMAVITGLVFARFSRPRARMLFSRVAVVGLFDGRRALMLRVVNQRHGALAEATARLTLMRVIPLEDGKSMRRFVDLHLERASTPMIALSWTLIHIIDEHSPLSNLSPESLHGDAGVLMASINGYDESISATVVARQTYSASAVLFDHRFVDIIDQLPTGEVVLDMGRFHDVAPLVRPEA